MKERSYLKDKVTLLGESNGAHFERTFTILKVISEGADGIIYEALHEKSGKGVLKEFYPLDRVLPERDEDGVLTHSSGMQGLSEHFGTLRETFLRPYEMLLKIRQSSDDKDISSFIPAFEIYCGKGSDEDRESTVYVWSPEPEIETFDRICGEIHRHPSVKPAHKLVTALTAIETLTKCICALHSAGIIHRDIKPSNFGFINRRGETLTQAISMFDIDSLCSVWDEVSEVKGTPGFTEPEAKYEECSNQTDIYSIGATLFTAIIVTDETKAGGYVYKDSYYGRLKELVDSSELIRASESNSHPRLRYTLASILQKCLCGRSERYENCEALLADLQEALFYALPAEVARRSRAGEKWVLSQADKLLDANADKNSYLSILCHLYEHPLYEAAEEGTSTIRVSVLGFDSCGQKFLDACLQAGQMRGNELEVRIIGADSVDREIYLSDRPQLADFFDIDGSISPEDAYGRVRFNHDRYEPADYTFISLGSDQLNRRTAAECKKINASSGKTGSISYVCEKADSRDLSGGPVHAVPVSSDVRSSANYKEIERMAFNTHLVWEKSPNLDHRQIKKEFRKRYNHDSCVSSVISLKYKLHSMGIDLGKTSFADAAKEYTEALSRGGDQLKDELIWIEHRRWVTEKLVLGWTCISDLQQCLTGKTKDDASRQHVCIVRSRPDQKLAGITADPAYGSRWELIPDTVVDGLDELDRMSVRLHRVYAERAKEILQTGPAHDHRLEGIRTEISHPKTVRAFNEWIGCIRSLYEGDAAKARLYKGLEFAFLEAVNENEPGKREMIAQLTKGFREYFFPVIASLNPHDWKKEDTDFIDSAAFVLTYTEKSWLLIPFHAGASTAERFANVSAATLIDPEKIIYLYRANDEKELRELERTMPAVTSYLKNKGLRASVQLRAIDDGAESLIRSMKRRNRTAIAAVEKNGSETSRQLERLGVYDELPWYSFDPGGCSFDYEGSSFDHAGSSFEPNEGCEAFGYIRRQPSVSVSDMLSFSDLKLTNAERPEYHADYDDLWVQYAENSGAWDGLCLCLREYSEEHDILASFCKDEMPAESSGAEYRYIIPAMCRDGAALVLDGLVKSGAAGTDSRIVRHTSGSYEAVIYAASGQREQYEKLFSAIYALNMPELLHVKAREDGTGTDVIFDDLTVSDLPLTGRAYAGAAPILELLAQKGLILAPHMAEGSTSFTFASGQIKHLLGSPAAIKELYTYHRLMNSGKYNDIVIGDVETASDSETGRQRCCLAVKGLTAEKILL